MANMDVSFDEGGVIMASVQKPTVFFVGKKKENAPAEPVITKEKMEQCIQNVQQFLRSSKK